MSDQAAAIVVPPVAMATAYQFSLNPHTFAMMIAVAASCFYLTPLKLACLMAYGPGRYRFRDFARVGIPLTLLIFAITIVVVPRFWPLRIKLGARRSSTFQSRVWTSSSKRTPNFPWAVTRHWNVELRFAPTSAKPKGPKATR